MQFLFAYGTLKHAHPDRPASCPPPLAIHFARAPGRLWLLPEGYPILQVDPAYCLLDATDNPAADWARAASLPPSPGLQGPWIEGELLAYPRGPDALAPFDEWENFAPGRPGPYQRRIIRLQDETSAPCIAWAYLCFTPPAPSTLLHASHWP